ncbi:hypothetical protein Cantr_05939 [Candida viswanathii]|uniref:LicD/FKTN/FKRP nucleotidyltransferase domain-containing protein n=1 Tax=Candida viswanathii TaxID=5486 RepID=A0A367XPM8_9ASCO|nr:hypothetical protein Cantr_05939 [Candida viswanathii]
MVFLTTITVLSTTSEKYNYFDELILKVYDHNYLNKNKLKYLEKYEPEKYLNLKVNALIQEKKSHDLENKFWLLDTTLKEDDTTIALPDHFANSRGDRDESSSVAPDKPIVSTFDPRFTLGMYYAYINEQMTTNPGQEVTIPFNWYDWVDMSVLNKYLVAPNEEKPGCDMLDAREDARKILNKKKKVEKLAAQWEDDKKKAEEERKKAEEEARKKEEEEKKKEEEEKKKAEEEAKKTEEDKKKEEEEKKKQEEEAKKKEEEKKKQEEAAKKAEDEKKKQQDQAKQEEEEKKKQQDLKEALEEKQKQGKQEGNKLVKRDDDFAVNEIKSEPSEAPQPPPKKIDMAKVFEDAYSKISDEEQKKLQEDVENAVKRVLDPKIWCIADSELSIDHPDNHLVHPGFNVFRNPGRTTEKKAILAGKSFLYSFGVPPALVLFLTAEGSYHVNVKQDAPLMNNGIPEDYVSKRQGLSLNMLEEFHALKKAHKPDTANVIDEHLLDIPKSSFRFNGTEMIAKYEDKMKNGGLTIKELKYLRSLKYSAHSVAHGGPPKYFSESRLVGTTIGDHYDWRFFNGVMTGTIEQSLTLHRLIRTWLSFTRKTGITTWIAHGSLLSWYWNGIAFPWDNDIDVQVPIMDLHKLSLEYNQTMVVEDPEDGFGRYFLDCGTFITLREKGNGNNNIDARFIDIDTGLYIDITGLALSNTKTPDVYQKELPKSMKKDVKDTKDYRKFNEYLEIYNCRNNHFSSYEDLSPLVKSTVEGEIGYIPSRYSGILDKEYRDGRFATAFSGHIFIPKIRLWIKEQELYYFFHNKTRWRQYHSLNTRLGENPETQLEDYSYELTDEEYESLQYTHENPYKKIERPITLTEQERKRIAQMSETDLLDFLMNDEILINYYNTRKFTSFHEQEIMQLTFGKSTAKLMSNAIDFPPLQFEPYLYRLHIE